MSIPDTPSIKRLRRRLKTCPNPLFTSWLKEWRNEAKKNGSEMQYCFARALRSLQKFPFRLETGKECCILENFGSKICMMLDKKLEEYNYTGQSDKSAQAKSSLKSLGKHNCDLSPAAEKRKQPKLSLTSSNSRRRNNDSSPTSAGNCVIIDCLSDSSEVNDSELLCENNGVTEKDCNKSQPLAIKSNKEKRNSCGGNRGRKMNGLYLPAFRSGGYALILTLRKNSNPMTKNELENEAQILCDASFKRKPSSDSHYTAWSAMSTLIKKGLVEKSGRPPRFFLTEKGRETADELESLNDGKSDGDTGISSASAETECIQISKNEESPACVLSESIFHDVIKEMETLDDINITNKKTDNVCPTSSRSVTDVQSKTKKSQLEFNCAKTTGHEINEEPIFLTPNDFDIVLYVDTQEIDNKQNVDNDKIVKYLRRRCVKFEVKRLNIGDYLWVCRDAGNNHELVLPYIVERKRMDDLAMSIRDGRFHEQKFRLKHCGVPNCIYLVEKYGNDCHRLGLPLPTIQQAISNTKVIDGFHVKITTDSDDSLSYLCGMTNFLTRIFKPKTLTSCNKRYLQPFNMSDELISLMTFAEFNKDSEKMKKFTVRNMLVKHLLQLSGLSVEKAVAIVKIYPTPKSLMKALQCSNGETVIANIKCGNLNRCIGSALAKTLYQLYTYPKLG